LRAGDQASAIAHYLRALQAMPGLSKTITGNLAMARQKYRAARTAEKRLSVAVCSSGLSHNAAERVITLAKLYKTYADVEIIGSHFPAWGRVFWESIRETTLAHHSFEVSDESRFLEQALALVAAHPYDLIHLSKPRAPNIFFGILYKLIWNAKVLMDIDEEELSLVNAETPINADDYIARHAKLFPLNDLPGQEWTLIAVGLAREFDGLTVSTPATHQSSGGEIIRGPLSTAANALRLQTVVDGSVGFLAPALKKLAQATNLLAGLLPLEFTKLAPQSTELVLPQEHTQTTTNLPGKISESVNSNTEDNLIHSGHVLLQLNIAEHNISALENEISIFINVIRDIASNKYSQTCNSIYTSRYLDVKNAILAGHFVDGLQHHELFGREQRRIYSLDENIEALNSKIKTIKDTINELQNQLTPPLVNNNETATGVNSDYKFQIVPCYLAAVKSQLADPTTKKIAIHLHLYYIDSLGEFTNYLNNISQSYDLYVSIPYGKNEAEVFDRLSSVLSCVNTIVVECVPNRGNPPKLSPVTPCKPCSDAVSHDFSVVAACDQAPVGANLHPAGRMLFPIGFPHSPVPTPCAGAGAANTVQHKNGCKCAAFSRNRPPLMHQCTPKKPNCQPTPWHAHRPSAHAASARRHFRVCSDA
jgi:hypothetical protein